MLNVPSSFTRPTLSFVIPAYNEESMLGRTLSAIRRFAPTDIPYEVVVVDNGSTDGTAAIAAAQGATVVQQPHGTIGELRNVGVMQSSGRVIAFLDADVTLTESWTAGCRRALRLLEADASLLTGSACRAPKNSGWIERLWFDSRDSSSLSHIGSGHLLITREFFDLLGGFDSTLVTGEDFDLSRRALLAGGRVTPDQSLVVEHHGFPRNLREFVRREAWHGQGDFRDLQSVVSSKVALATVGFTIAHVVLVVSLFSNSVFLGSAALATIVSLCGVSSFLKYGRHSFAIVVVNTAIFYAYYAGRSLALVRRLLPATPRSRRER
jgi:cellulose synthase/poly-beta-1,6-N-acetylglucosamine synthase-like glycosyltransferase